MKENYLFNRSDGDAQELADYHQAFLKGHTNKITILELSSDGRFLASAEGGEKGNIFIWDIAETGIFSFLLFLIYNFI